MSVLDVPAATLAALAPSVEALTAAEGLGGHWRAVKVRVEKRAAKAAPARGGTRKAKKGGRR